MNIQFKPHVVFQSQNSDLLYLQIQRRPHFIELNNKPSFDYSLLTNGVPLNSLSDDTKTFLESTQLCEIVESNSADELPPALQFLKHFSSTSKGVNELFEKIKKMNFIVLDLSNMDYNFLSLSKVGSITVINEVQKLANLKTGESFILIVIVESFLHPVLTEINGLCLNNKWDWILVKCDNMGTSLGPHFVNSPVAFCFECFKARIVAKAENALLENYNSVAINRNKHWGRIVEQNWLEFELLKYVISSDPYLDRQVINFDSISSKIEGYPVHPYPICDVCR